MKAAPYFFYLLLLSLSGYSPGLRAQRGIGTANPAASAALEVASTNKGLLIPRVGLVSPTQWAPITGLATHTSDGMLVYNAPPTLSGEGLYYWETASPTSAWKVVGNNLYTKDGGLAGNRVIQSGGQDLNIRMNASGRFLLQSLTRSTTLVNIFNKTWMGGNMFDLDDNPFESIRYINAVNTNANARYPHEFIGGVQMVNQRPLIQRVGQATYWGYALKLKPDKVGVIQRIQVEMPDITNSNPALGSFLVQECYYQGSLLFRGNRQPNPGSGQLSNWLLGGGNGLPCDELRFVSTQLTAGTGDRWQVVNWNVSNFAQNEGVFPFTIGGHSAIRDGAVAGFGLNTTAPTQALHVRGASRLRGLATQATLTATGQLLVSDANGVLETVSSTAFRWDTFYATDGALLSPSTVTTGDKRLEFITGTGDFLFHDTAGNPVMAVDGSANRLGFRTTTPHDLLEVNGAIFFGQQLEFPQGFSLGSSNAAGAFTSQWRIEPGASHELFFREENTPQFYVITAPAVRLGFGTASPTQTIDVNGTAGATGFLTGSDWRFKKEIQPLDTAASYDKIMQLQAVRFLFDRERFSHKNFPDSEQIGLIAQAVEDLLPDLVVRDEAGYRSVDYSRLSVYLLEAICLREAQLNKQEKALTALEKNWGCAGKS